MDEAYRYLENAKVILRDKGKKGDKYYKDPKKVKMAGNTAYNGVLVLLDGLLGVKEKGRNTFSTLLLIVDFYLL